MYESKRCLIGASMPIGASALIFSASYGVIEKKVDRHFEKRIQRSNG